MATAPANGCGCGYGYGRKVERKMSQTEISDISGDDGNLQSIAAKRNVMSIHR